MLAWDLIPTDFTREPWWTKWHLNTIFSRFLRFPLLIIILLLPQTHLSTFSKVCSTLGQVAHYLITCLKVRGVKMYGIYSSYSGRQFQESQSFGMSSDSKVNGYWLFCSAIGPLSEEKPLPDGLWCPPNQWISRVHSSATKRPKCKVVAHIYILLPLRMHGALLPLLRTSSWCGLHSDIFTILHSY